MSTHNGEPHVAAQLDSILRQDHPNLRLRIRDDGSSDGTVALLDQRRDARTVVEKGKNLGLPDAFFRLIDDSSDDAEFWALADQDDVWRPDKISRAVGRLLGVEGPALYCARVLVTDEALTPLYPHELPKRGPSFANALVQNIALGCTIVMNRQARDLVRGRWPADCVMHDAWLYLAVAGCGTVVYDDELVVEYRQHARNTVGMGRGPISRLVGRVRRQLTPGGPGKHGRQDRELLRLFGDDLRPDARRELEELLEAMRSWPARFGYAVKGPAHRQTRGSDAVLKCLLVLGRV